MARKAFVWINDPPTMVDNDGWKFKINVQITFCDDQTGDAHCDSNGHFIEFTPTLLTTARTQLRDLAKDLGDSLHGWTLGNGDVHLPDWGRELL